MPEAKKKIGRNDPCPCGSGKKFKKCCYPDKTREWKTSSSYETPAFRVKLKESPEPIRDHLVSSDDGKTWESRPGLLEVKVFGKKPGDIDGTISNVIDPVCRDLFSVAEHELLTRIKTVEHKLYAVRYHLNNYEHAESDKIEEFKENYKPPTGAQVVIEEPRLIYEVEAFLFQAKSCLDVLSWVLKPVFGFEYCKFGDKGDYTINQLSNNCPATLATYAEKLVKLIEGAQDEWIVELITMRDQIMHRSELEGFYCFIQDPYIGGDTANIHYTMMPNNRRALEYCHDIWEKLLSFCEGFLKLTVEAEKAKTSD